MKPATRTARTLINALAAIAVPLVYTSYNDYQGYLAKQEFEDRVEDYFGDDLVSLEIRESRATIVVRGNHSRKRLEEAVSTGFRMRLIEIPE